VNSIRLWKDSERAKIADKIRSQVVMAIARAYLRGDFRKPLEKLTDAEVLAAYGCGPATLRELRSVFPEPTS